MRTGKPTATCIKIVVKQRDKRFDINEWRSIKDIDFTNFKNVPFYLLKFDKALKPGAAGQYHLHPYQDRLRLTSSYPGRLFPQGYAVSTALDTALMLQALKMAVAERKPDTSVIHHSDHGVQYAQKNT